MTEHLSDADLNALEALVDAATPGPWCGFKPEGSNGYAYVDPVGEKFEQGFIATSYGPDDAEANVQFIAAARNALPALLAEVREHRLAQGAERGSR